MKSSKLALILIISILGYFAIIIFMYLSFNNIYFVIDSEQSIPPIVKQLKLKHQTLKAGQVWGFKNEGKNPFEEPIRFHVVAVKDGYVKYYFVGQENYGEWAAKSETISWFMRNTKLIKDADYNSPVPDK